jgi:predicted lipid-binding transport protein (Tim44 family)
MTIGVCREPDRPGVDSGTLGGRGSRSNSAPARPVPPDPDPFPVPATAPPALPTLRRGGLPTLRRGGWMGPLASFTAGSLIGTALFGVSGGLLDLLLISGGIALGIALFAMSLRRRLAAAAQPMPEVVNVSNRPDTPPRDSSLDRGVRDIRRTDSGFDPTRFVGYTAMVFRDVQNAWMTRDIGALRDRVTPELYGELQVRCDRLRSARQSNRVDRIEIGAEITEAWQEGDRDYVTAYIGGSMIDYTVDEATDGLVNGSRAIPKDIEEFWTFTRRAGLNFWMLSAVQTS